MVCPTQWLPAASILSSLPQFFKHLLTDLPDVARAQGQDRIFLFYVRDNRFGGALNRARKFHRTLSEISHALRQRAARDSFDRLLRRRINI